MSLPEFLTWLANSGGSIIAVSWLIERWSWYQKQTKENKQYLFFGLSFSVSALAYVILTAVPAEVLEMIKPYFLMLYATFSTVFLGTAFHKVSKIRK